MDSDKIGTNRDSTQAGDDERLSQLILADGNTDTMILPDGRTLCFTQYGATSGPAIFYLHGGGDARKGGAFFHEPATRVGARIIACDRPGIGRSSPQPNRTVIDHTSDIECLADHLDIEKFGVVGVSGGGPYALACAYSIPHDLLKAVSIVCGMADPATTLANTGWGFWAMLRVSQYLPPLFRWFMNYVVSMNKKPDEELKKMYRQQAQQGFWKGITMSEPDAKLFENDDFLDFAISGNRCYSAQGIDNVIEEYRVWTSDPGFKIEDIQRDLPIQLWYGKYDLGCTVQLGEALKAGLGDRATLNVMDEGHASLFVNCRDQILRNLIEAMSSSR